MNWLTGAKPTTGRISGATLKGRCRTGESGRSSLGSMARAFSAWKDRLQSRLPKAIRNMGLTDSVCASMGSISTTVLSRPPRTSGWIKRGITVERLLHQWASAQSFPHPVSTRNGTVRRSTPSISSRTSEARISRSASGTSKSSSSCT
jgi:hypothetical protein